MLLDKYIVPYLRVTVISYQMKNMSEWRMPHVVEPH
jgi:hypothetical protein